MNKGTLIVVKGDTAYDMSNMVSSVKWGGRRGSPARYIDVDFIDDDGFRHERPEIDVREGHQCLFSWNGTELFRGMFMNQTQTAKKTVILKAYDNGIRLSNNEDTFQFKNKTASEIFTDCCNRFLMPVGEVADTNYRISELIKPKTTAWDAIADALAQTYESTGERYFVIFRNEKANLIKRTENVLQWVLETGVNLSDYSQNISIENVRTRIKLMSREGSVLAEASDTEIEKKIGVFQKVENINDEMNSGQLKTLADSMLDENSPDNTLVLNSLGQADVISGMAVFVVINHLGISKTYYIEEDAHTFTENHKMSLKMTLKRDYGNKH